MGWEARGPTEAEPAPLFFHVFTACTQEPSGLLSLPCAGS